MRNLHRIDGSPVQFLLATAVLLVIVISQVRPASSLIIAEVRVEFLNIPRNVDVDSNGLVWFTAGLPGPQPGVGAYSDGTGSFTIYPRSSPSDPYDIALVKDPVTLKNTDPWFTDQGTDSVVRIVGGTSFADFNLPPGSDPHGITGGLVGGVEKVYFTESNAGASKIGEIDATGTIREWQLALSSSPESIFFESQKRIWFTELGADRIGVLDPTGSGTIVEYTLTVNTRPWGIVVDSLGNVWFAESTSGKLGKLSFPGGVAKLEEYTIPFGNFNPREVTVDSFDNVWFTGFSSSFVGKFDRGSGLVQVFPTPTSSSQPWGIAAAPNNAIWYAESNASAKNLGRISLSQHFTTSTATSIPRATTTIAPASSTAVTTVTNSAVATSSSTTVATFTTLAITSTSTIRSETILVVATVITGQTTVITGTTTVSGTISTTVTQTFTASIGTTITGGTQTVTQTQTTTQTSTLFSIIQLKTTQVGTLIVNPAVPGFPTESIVAGIVIGLLTLLVIRHRRKA